jgi:hypothetical protein
LLFHGNSPKIEHYEKIYDEHSIEQWNNHHSVNSLRPSDVFFGVIW